MAKARRAKLKGRTAGKPRAHPGNTALLLIDVINDLDFEGNAEVIKVAEAMAPRVARLSESARSARVPVIYVNDNFGLAIGLAAHRGAMS